jgi:hypothetical protein
MYRCGVQRTLDVPRHITSFFNNNVHGQPLVDCCVASIIFGGVELGVLLGLSLHLGRIRRGGGKRSRQLGWGLRRASRRVMTSDCHGSPEPSLLVRGRERCLAAAVLMQLFSVDASLPELAATELAGISCGGSVGSVASSANVLIELASGERELSRRQKPRSHENVTGPCAKVVTRRRVTAKKRQKSNAAPAPVPPSVAALAL